jgi:hypothetical protein
MNKRTERDPNFNFKKEVLKALHKGVINSVEAKECLIRGFDSELPIFFLFREGDPYKAYIEGLEKMNLIRPLIRLGDDIPYFD